MIYKRLVAHALTFSELKNARSRPRHPSILKKISRAAKNGSNYGAFAGGNLGTVAGVVMTGLAAALMPLPVLAAAAATTVAGAIMDSVTHLAKPLVAGLRGQSLHQSKPDTYFRTAVRGAGDGILCALIIPAYLGCMAGTVIGKGTGWLAGGTSGALKAGMAGARKAVRKHLRTSTFRRLPAVPVARPMAAPAAWSAGLNQLGLNMRQRFDRLRGRPPQPPSPSPADDAPLITAKEPPRYIYRRLE